MEHTNRTIRPLTQQDLEAYLDIYLNAYPAYKTLDEACREHYREKHRLELREDRQVQTVGLFEGDVLIATMKLILFSMNCFGRMQTACGLMALEVHPLHKKQGAALEMIRYFEDYARRHGALLTLLLPFQISFYRRMGYGFAGKLYEYHLPTAVLPKPDGEARRHLRLLQPEDFDRVLACHSRFAAQNHGMVEKFEEEVRAARTDVQVRRIGYCADAYVYDEQPTTMKDSWRQRMRWAKGFYQVLLKYGSFLFNGIFRGKQGRFACYDMFMTIAPAMLLTLAGVAVNLVFCLTGIVQMAGIAASVQTVAASTSGGAGVVASDPNWFSMATGMMSGSVFEGDPLSSFNISQVSTVLAYAEARATIVTSVLSLAGCFLSFAVVMLVFGTLTTITEWNHIHAKNSDKIKYLFTFPIFMLTYVPIALIAVFKKVEWKPITHNVVRSVADVVSKG